jgi:two-component system, LuxR family, sensor kinase FixL
MQSRSHGVSEPIATAPLSGRAPVGNVINAMACPSVEQQLALLRTIIETSADCIKLTDREGCVQMMNAAGLQFLEVDSPQDVLGRSLSAVVHPADRPAVEQLHARVLQGESGRLTFAITGRRGTHRVLETTEAPLRDKDGKVVAAVSVTRDVTQQQALELRLWTSQQRLAEAQRIAQIGDWVWDLATDTITWSDEVYRIFGHPPESFVPRYREEFLLAIPPEDRRRVDDAVKESLRTLKPYSIKHHILRRDRTERVVWERGEVILGLDGQPQRMVGTVQDVTDQVRVEDELRSLHDELTHMARLVTLGEMASGIAHELNQPLAAIAAYAAAAASTLGVETDGGHHEAGEFLAKIAAQAQRAGDIIRRIRQMSRGTASRRVLVSVNDLIGDVLALLAADFRLQRVALQTGLASNLPAISADPIQIQQVLVNLLRNALDALRTVPPDRRRIELSSGPAAGHAAVWIRVRDTGDGVSPEAAATLFEAFHTTKTTGLGLGLAISRRIIEAHEGCISHEAPADGGAAFTIMLPRGCADV